MVGKINHLATIKNNRFASLNDQHIDICFLHGFDGGLELRLKGRDKGYAVRTVLDEEGEGVWGAYLGDDWTDEDGFKAIKGRGLPVLVRQEYRETEAEIWLKPPEELLGFLNLWVA